VPSWSISVVLPCTGTWRTTVPPNACAERLVAEADAERRHAGLGKRRITSTLIPASLGVHGPGETTTRS
jgi:hypothetical protein